MGSRRGRGEGTIYQRADGRWCAQVTLANGARKSLYGKSRKDVAARMRALQNDLARGVSPGDGRQTLATCLTTWLESARPPQLAESTWKTYESNMRLHVIPALGNVKLAQLQPQQIAQLYTDLQREKGLSSTTVHHVHAALHRALEMALRFGVIGRNVSSMVNAPRNRDHEIHPLSRDEARAYLAATDGHRLAALYTLALATGMRQGELLALHWRDVDVGDSAPTTTSSAAREGRLSVTSNLYVRRGVATFKPPKTKGSRRQIALSPHVVEALRAHRARQRQERLKAGASWQDYDLVFATEVGTPLSPKTAYYHHTRFLRAAGLDAVGTAGTAGTKEADGNVGERVRFHDLRHTCATLLLLQRVNPKVVSEMLGHASVGITLDIYSHVLPDMQQDAAAAMALALGWA